MPSTPPPMQDFKHLVNAPNNETWQQALERFKTLAHADMAQVWDDGEGNVETVIVNLSEVYDEGLLYEQAPPEPLEAIKTCEDGHDLSVPASLKALMCEHGAFAIYMVSLSFGERWGERTFLEIFHSKNYPNIKPLCTAMAFFGNNHFVETELTPEQAAFLNQQYFCFSCICPSDSDIHFLYFDRNHQFGVFRLVGESYPEIMQNLQPLLAQNIPMLTLNQLLSASMDETIKLVLEYSEVYLDYES